MLIGVPLQISKIQQTPFALDALVMFQHALAGTIPGAVNAQGLLSVLSFSELFELCAECAVQLNKAVFTAFAHGFALGPAGGSFAWDR